MVRVRLMRFGTKVRALLWNGKFLMLRLLQLITLTSKTNRHYPVGVLFDTYGSPLKLPWSINVHFQAYPVSQLARYFHHHIWKFEPDNLLILAVRILKQWNRFSWTVSKRYAPSGKGRKRRQGIEWNEGRAREGSRKMWGRREAKGREGRAPINIQEIHIALVLFICCLKANYLKHGDGTRMNYLSVTDIHDLWEGLRTSTCLSFL